MPRTIQITVPSAEADALVGRLRSLPGVLGMSRQAGASLKPPGDIPRLNVLNRVWPQVMQFLDEAGVGSTAASSLSSAQPITLLSAPDAAQIANDSSEASWEEMALVIGQNSNMTIGAITVMAVAGIFATIGIATNALHLVLAAMLVAPGFQPIVRIALGWVGRSVTWRAGVRHVLIGYAVLIAAAAITAWWLQLIGTMPAGGESSYLPSGALITYWLKPTPESLMASFVAAIAGATLIASDRAVLTAGVMVGLALVPGATIAGIGIALGDGALITQGLLRWGTEFLCVVIGSLAVLGVVRATRQRRPMRL
jgi:hypothetical protein